MKILAASAFTLAVLAGCATSKIDPASAPKVGTENVIDRSILEGAASKGAVRIARDSGAYGSGLDVLIYIDGRHVANMESNSVLVANLPEGRRNIGMQVDSPTAKIQQIAVDVQSGKTVDVRISMDGGDWRISRQ
ncbi:hypothetical protein [Pandoraea sp. CB10b_02]|uniref:hypothetical protein n=1 Tax=Pandoraea sp. CB10b_02 TaxID=2014535 RepID=UPI00257A3F00|nr:hypothetical protein [Pandoraea sp. CB10b_02]